MKRLALFLLLLSSTSLFAADVKQIVDSTAFVLEEGFLVPERGKQIGAALRAKNVDPKLEGQALADALTALIQTIEDDKHLYVRFDPAKASEPMATRDEMRAGLQPLRRVLIDPSAESLPKFTSKMLDGNIGYLEIFEFENPVIARPQFTAAMESLERARAMIIDLRQCRGGAQQTVNYLASYFFPQDNRVLLTSHMRGGDRDNRVEATPTRKFENVPLYILTSDKTFSAGEAFSYILQQYGRAQTIGASTRGGGRHNVRVDIGAGFLASVSVADVEHPKTKKGWQGTGVIADIKAEDALAEAVRLAKAAAPKSAAASK